MVSSVVVCVCERERECVCECVRDSVSGGSVFAGQACVMGVQRIGGQKVEVCVDTQDYLNSLVTVEISLRCL